MGSDGGAQALLPDTLPEDSIVDVFHNWKNKVDGETTLEENEDWKVFNTKVKIKSEVKNRALKDLRDLNLEAVISSSRQAKAKAEAQKLVVKTTAKEKADAIAA